MKNLLVATLLFAAASSMAFAAPCSSGVTLTALQAGPVCTVTASNGNGTWNFSNWSLQSLSTTGFGVGVTQNTSDFIVNLAGVADGVAVTFSDNPGTTSVNGITPNPFNFFAPNGTVTTQTASFRVGYWVSGGPNFIAAFNSVQNPTSGASFNVLKTLENFNGTAIIPGDAQVTIVNGVAILPSPATIILGPSRTDLSVYDTVQISSFQTGSGSIDSFTNTFKTAQAVAGVPEPTTFLFMGVALVGLAASRLRRK